MRIVAVAKATFEIVILTCAASGLAACGARSAIDAAPTRINDATPDASTPDASTPLCISSAIILASETSDGTDLGAFVRNSTNVYWDDESRNVVTVSKSGGAPTIVVPATTGTYVTVDETYAYYDSDYGKSLTRAPLAGGTPTTLVSIPTFFLKLVVDKTNVYYLIETPLGSEQAELWSIPKAGGTPRILYSASTATDFVVDDESVFVETVTNADAASAGASSMRIDAIPIAGGAPTTLIAESSLALSEAHLAMDASSIYWLEYSATKGDGSIARIAKSGGAKTVLVSAPILSTSTPIGAPFAVGRTNIYWASNDSIMTVSKAGGVPTVLATGQTDLTLAVDDSGLYWTAGFPTVVLKRSAACE